MPVASVGKYEFAPRDVRERFPAPLLYVGWDDHKMFCAPFAVPLPPTMRFGELCRGPLAAMFGAHPDFARVDWSRVAWLRSGQPFDPDPEKTLAENGLGHKDVLRFRTPGLLGLAGSAF